MMTSEDAAALPGLRERRRRQTRREIADAAIQLFCRQGVEHTTVDDIAHAAGVSPRTFFRYAATKQHAIFVDDDGRERLLAAVRADAAGGASPLAAIERAHTLLLAEFDDLSPAEQERGLRVRELIFADEGLLALALARDAETLDQLVAFVRERDPGTLSALQARTLVTAVGTAFRLTLDEWAHRATDGERVSTRRLYAEIRGTLVTFFGEG